MANCSHPYIFYTNNQINEKTGKKIYHFSKFDYKFFIYLRNHHFNDFVLVPCGKCDDCRLNYRKQWSIRLLNEMQTSKNAYFLTLTYKDDCIPFGNTLIKSHLQRFFKSLKNHFNRGCSSDIKYFACGEYGSNTLRPHYHAIVFNLPDDDFSPYFPTDKCFYVQKFSKTGEKLFFSSTIENLWNKGFTDIGNVSFNSCSYVAGYVQKKLYGEDSQFYTKLGLTAPFMICSRGLGKDYFLYHKNEICKTNEIFYSKNNIIKSSSCPRYYLKLLEKYDNDAFNKLKVMNKQYTDNLINTLCSMTNKELKDYFNACKVSGSKKSNLLVRG